MRRERPTGLFAFRHRLRITVVAPNGPTIVRGTAPLYFIDDGGRDWLVREFLRDERGLGEGKRGSCDATRRGFSYLDWRIIHRLDGGDRSLERLTCEQQMYSGKRVRPLYDRSSVPRPRAASMTQCIQHLYELRRQGTPQP